MKYSVWLLAFFVMLTAADSAHAGGRRGSFLPAPRLFEPTDDADLRGKTELLFRWGSEGDRSAITDYQFKLYKGTQTVESGLIKAETLPSSQDHVSLPSELFENGGTYTWQLKGTGSAKTRPSYSIFKVLK